MNDNGQSLDGRLAAVTGAGSGIGAAITEALAAKGASIACLDISLEAAQAQAKRLSSAGHEAQALEMDVTDSEAVARVAKELSKEKGAADILVCCAGIAISNVKAEDMTDEQWRKVMAVNLDGVFYCCREFGKRMLVVGKGTIVNIGSMSGAIVNRPQEQCQYNASKAGVHHLTRSLAAEWAARGVRVNAVAPTYTETKLVKSVLAQDPAMEKVWVDSTPMNRLAQPVEIASVVAFLASDDSSAMTGAVVDVDCGYQLW